MAHWRSIARDAGSILLGQLATIGFGVVDTLMAGRASPEDLAALSIGAAIYICVFIGLTGVVQALIPLVGHHRGSNAPAEVGQVFQQGVWLAAFLSLPGMALLFFPGPLLALTDVAPEVAQRTRDYLHWLGWGLPLALLFRCYSGLNQGISRPLLVTVLQLGGLALKVPLNAWFVFGGAGLPAFGAPGCAVATVIVLALQLAVGGALLARHPLYRPFALWSGWTAPRWADQKELLRLGLPAGASYFVEVTAFALMAVFISHFGTTALAGHQVVANLASVAYMLPLSIAVATGARVAQLRGAGHPREAFQAGWHGIRLAAGLSVALGLVLWLLRSAIVGFYSPDPAVRAVALQLFLFIAVYQIFDASQITTAFALRSFRIALAPALAYVVSLWGIGLAGGWLLGFNVTGGVPEALQGARGFWAANLAALALVASLLALMYRRVGRTLSPA
ncbi:MATE family efflux transporter [Caldimonas caldifontis]|uniref:MATE family efflux transporter n=1 Tax=Caldimonas caldifontis TaxID=1452508 RepID=A0A2S5ST28_9BURK|nr:MATE family efflux transporter [Caldimonas caldifontis]PPE65892.1 MATE family efflux transporter [Caldimonas caldifontis]